MRRNRARVIVWLVIVLTTLTACAAPTPQAPAQDASATAPAPRKPVRTGGPLPAEPLPDTPVQVDRSCRTDADCTVKNVGNCCGYFPACVNVDSPTDPEGVQAHCARAGIASVCGFREIASCHCVDGQCQDLAAGAETH